MGDRETVIRFSARDIGFRLLRSVKTGCGAHLASYSMGTGGKAAGT
jgi:hypothetical protein